jgi:hypothetical protein
MILVRQVFQVKYGNMDKVLEMMKSMPAEMQDAMGGTMVLTDISGQNFTLVIETKAESMNAYWSGLQAMFKEGQASGGEDPMAPLIISGHREFYNIEYESGR